MSASGAFGPAPEGIDLSDTQNLSISSAVITLMIIGSMFVGLRLVARLIHRDREATGLAIDDYCIALGLLFAYGTAICSLASLPYGGGKHLWVLTTDEFGKIWQILFAYVMIYACAVTFTKLSIVLFYQRIFGMTWGLWACTFLVISYWLVVCITILLACRPLEFFWLKYTMPGAVGTCINVPQFFFANGIWAMLVDVCILLVPIPIVYSLKMSKNQKIVVLSIFLLGSFVCIASIVRITTIQTVITSPDLTWAMGKLFIWSCCEPFIGIVCACLPTLAPLFRRWIKLTTSTLAGTETPTSKSKSTSSHVNSGSRIGSQVVKKPWSKLNGGSQSDVELQLRDDEEMELTINITGPKSAKSRDGRKVMDGDGRAYRGSDIMVRKDMTWSSNHV